MASATLPEVNGAALKAAREKRGMQRSELATHCCLSSKMIAELEEGGVSSFYNFQLRLSAAKRVGSYLGLAAEDYLQEVAQVIEKVDAPVVEKNRPPPKAEEKQKPINETHPDTQSPLNEGEHLDDLIYESTSSGTLLPHANLRVPQAKWIRMSVLVLLGIVALYGIKSWFHAYNQDPNFLVKNNNQNVQPPEPPSGPVAQNQQLISEDPKPPIKTETKGEAVIAATPSSNLCAPFREDQSLVYKSPNPSKSGDTIYIKTLVKQSVCVTDSQAKQFLVDLEPNMAQSFRGTPPFLLSAQDLDNVEMFYQGWRVRPPNTGMKQMKLVEVVIQ